ncbi:MAG: hypothetical protein ABI461_21695 [Polyangiaceae bacterium]
MRSLLLPLVGIVTVSVLTVGACGGTTDAAPASSDAAAEAAPRYEAGSNNNVPYVRTTPLCVAAPYADAGVVTGPGFPDDDAGDEDGGATLGPPQLTSSGGPVLRDPRIVPITYVGDTLADQIEDFSGSIGCTDYWRQTTAEYGVNQAQMLTPVRLTTEAPATISDSTIRTFISGQINAKATGFFNTSTEVLYVFYFPSTTTIELQGATSCSQSSQSFGGYHDSFVMPGGKQIAYAVVARCGGDDMDAVTAAATHELIEATTDPYPLSATNSAYLNPDDAHIVYAFFGGGEAGDLCEFNRDADYIPSDYPFTVQRTWSNRSILAGHDPCVPAPSTPFVAGIPDQPDNVGVQYLGNGTTRGISIPMGGTRTVDVHFHSDDPATTTWTISANDASKYLEGTTHLTLGLDSTTAHVGQVVHLSITRDSAGAFGAEPFSIRSTVNGNTSSWYGVVGD